MADETPPDSPSRPPVHMGLRVVARHSAGRYGGRTLAREVTEAHRPKPPAAPPRLSRSASSAPPAPPAPPSAAPAAPAAPTPEASGAPAGPVAGDTGFMRPDWVPTSMS